MDLEPKEWFREASKTTGRNLPLIFLHILTIMYKW